MNVRFSARAQAELRSAIRYLADRNPSAAKRLRNNIYQAAQNLRDFPERGQRVGTGRLRRSVHGRYVILYQVVGQDVVIVHVLHGSRRLTAALSE